MKDQEFKKQRQEYVQEQQKSDALDLELIRRLLGYLRPYRFLLILGIILLFFSKLIEATVPAFLGHISQLILNHANSSSGQQAKVFQDILYASLILIGALFITYSFDSINVMLKSWVSQKGLYKLRLKVYSHIIQMPIAYFDKHAVGRLMTRTIHDVDQINQMFAESVIPILGNIFLFLSILILIFLIDWKIALIVLLVLPMAFLLTRRFRTYQRICYDRVRTVVAAMNTFVQEHLMGASTIRNFGLYENSQKRFEKINEDHCDAYMESIHHFAFFVAGIDFLQNLSLILAFTMIVLFSPFNGEFQAGTYFTFSLYVIMFFRPLTDLAERYNVLQSAMAAAARIFYVLDQPSEKAKDQGVLTLDGIHTIAFNDVWFAYKDENWILKGLSFEITSGESVALVGMTGEGKSTIMSLLLRFYEPQKGSIQINGRDISHYSLQALRHQFSVVLQDPVLFSGTVEENITLFNPQIRRTAVESLVDYLGIGHLIDSFPQKLDHPLIEHGKSLSAGEMQLISLARAAIYQRSVLILDEATANIDAQTEKVIQRALKKVLGKTTALVIAHRLSTIRDVTRILVLQDGKIAEKGSHASLLAHKGIYEKLYRLQFADADLS